MLVDVKTDIQNIKTCIPKTGVTQCFWLDSLVIAPKFCVMR